MNSVTFSWGDVWSHIKKTVTRTPFTHIHILTHATHITSDSTLWSEKRISCQLWIIHNVNRCGQVLMALWWFNRTGGANVKPGGFQTPQLLVFISLLPASCLFVCIPIFYGGPQKSMLLIIGSLVAAQSVSSCCLCGEMCQCVCWLNCLFTYLAFGKKTANKVTFKLA